VRIREEDVVPFSKNLNKYKGKATHECVFNISEEQDALNCFEIDSKNWKINNFIKK
jgi:hypothetical protein